ncbi:MAG TPA: SpoIIE family protein phosphatase [Thermotogota bacterium]|nr:SpoIIE family protein phosphatase [Thermotogota bacterium]
MPYRKELASVYGKLCELLGEPLDTAIENGSEEVLFQVIESQFASLQSEFVSYKDQLEESSIMLETQVEEISKTYEEISTLYEVTSLLSKTLNPVEVLDKLMDLILNSVPSGFISIYLTLESEEVFKYVSKEGRLLDSLLDALKKYFWSLTEQKQSKVIILEEEGIQKRFPVIADRIHSAIIVPLGTDKKLWGILTLANKQSSNLFTAGDRKLLESISNQIFFGLENFQFLQDKIQQERFFEQLEIAKKIQESLLPQKIPQLRRLDIACHFEPAVEVAGDYYDIIHTGDNVFLVIADVSGKGVPASLLMSSFRSTVRIFLSVTEELPRLVEKVNDHIAQNEIADRFITGLFVTLDLRTGLIKYVNAGHDPLLLYRPSEDRFFEITNDGIPTGIFQGETYVESEYTLLPGDVFILYTDGIPEARNEEKEEFGFTRMQEVLRSNCENSAEAISAALTRSLKQFVDSAPQHDDITYMILKYRGNQAE